MMDLPPVIVFDLDGTLWAPEMYQLFDGGGAPFNVVNENELVDRNGTKVRLLGDVSNILTLLEHSQKTTVAIASRTDEPIWAEECMKKFKTKNGRSLLSLCKIKEIYKGSKQVHLKEIARKSGYSQTNLLFFDNEMGNIQDAMAIGVHAVYCPYGITREKWMEGISMWRAKQNL